jgi:predicted Zn-dependent protease
MKNKFIIFVVCLSLIAVIGWPSLDLDDLRSSKNLKARLIDSTGVVTSSQVDTVINAAEKIKDASRGLGAQQEYYLGRGVAALILQKYPLYKADPELTKYVNLIGNALAIRSSRPEIFGGYHFAVIDTEEVNAISAPGGFIFISKGLLKIAPNEDALASVLAHEIGHVALGHGINAISNARINEATLMLGKEALNAFGPSELTALADNFAGSVDQIFDTLMNKGYSRTQEYEADAFAAQLLTKTNYSAKGLSLMLDELNRVHGQSKGGWSDTHPAPSERKASLKMPKQNLDSAAEQARATRFVNYKIR